METQAIIYQIYRDFKGFEKSCLPFIGKQLFCALKKLLSIISATLNAIAKLFFKIASNIIVEDAKHTDIIGDFDNEIGMI